MREITDAGEFHLALSRVPSRRRLAREAQMTIVDLPRMLQATKRVSLPHAGLLSSVGNQGQDRREIFENNSGHGPWRFDGLPYLRHSEIADFDDRHHSLLVPTERYRRLIEARRHAALVSLRPIVPEQKRSSTHDSMRKGPGEASVLTEMRHDSMH